MCLSHLDYSFMWLFKYWKERKQKGRKIKSRNCFTPRTDRSDVQADRSALLLTASPFWADRSVCLADRSDPAQWIWEFLYVLGFWWDLGYPPWTHMTLCEASWADALHGWFECIEVQSISISNGMERRDISSIPKYKTFSLVIANSIPFEDWIGCSMFPD